MGTAYVIGIVKRNFVSNKTNNNLLKALRSFVCN